MACIREVSVESIQTEQLPALDIVHMSLDPVAFSHPTSGSSQSAPDNKICQKVNFSHILAKGKVYVV